MGIISVERLRGGVGEESEEGMRQNRPNLSKFIDLRLERRLSRPLNRTS